MFLAAVLKGVHKHAGLLRAGIGTSGNEHRLGANEAPPAIISVFMGEMLTRLIENIAAGKEAGKGAEQQMIKLGVAKLPEIEKDNTDRNRTSPFAFTGQQVRVPRRRLVAVDRVPGHAAERRRRRGDRRAHGAAARDAQAHEERERRRAQGREGVVQGDGAPFASRATTTRTSGWTRPKKRGLLNLRRTPEALAQLTTKSRARC